MQSIFVFGSNEAGIHGAGAARFARINKGAKFGKGNGLVGYSYAIPTKDWNIKTLPYKDVANYVRKFVAFAEDHPDLSFQLTRVGCGLAGFTDEEMIPLFVGLPLNVQIPQAWSHAFPNHTIWTNV